MPRGDIEPMWTASLSIGLPVWSSRKQSRAVAESEAQAEAGAHGQEAVEQLLRLRVAERRTAQLALADTVRLYREGLLVQSRATAESTLAQYKVGRVTFASVLEANAGLIADEESFLSAVADAERLAIASLEPAGGPGGGATAGAMPGAGATGGGARTAAPAPSQGGAESSSAPSSGSSAGM